MIQKRHRRRSMPQNDYIEVNNSEQVNTVVTTQMTVFDTSGLFARAHMGEQQYIAYGRAVGQQHDQAVNANAQAACGR